MIKKYLWAIALGLGARFLHGGFDLDVAGYVVTVCILVFWKDYE